MIVLLGEGVNGPVHLLSLDRLVPKRSPQLDQVIREPQGGHSPRRGRKSRNLHCARERFDASLIGGLRLNTLLWLAVLVSDLGLNEPYTITSRIARTDTRK